GMLSRNTSDRHQAISDYEANRTYEETGGIAPADVNDMKSDLPFDSSVTQFDGQDVVHHSRCGDASSIVRANFVV
ncbi:MAG TPA: hypothetical protein VF920_13215, partial [Dongiaceae bacterium]